jgi:hypothetical protein
MLIYLETAVSNHVGTAKVLALVLNGGFMDSYVIISTN